MYFRNMTVNNKTRSFLNYNSVPNFRGGGGERENKKSAVIFFARLFLPAINSYNFNNYFNNVIWELKFIIF